MTAAGRLGAILRSRWTARAVGAASALLIAWWLHGLLTTPLPGAHVFTPFDTVRLPQQRTAADGTAYTVDPGRAVFALDMAEEDAASRRVFPSYAAALRHAREQGLPSMPSVPLVLAAGRALETRLQQALERRLDQGGDGRPALLRRWLALVRAQQPVCERAVRHLAEAIALDEGRSGGGTALGPWGEDEDLRRIWRRDRHLADALVVDDEASAVAAAVLARTLAGDAALAAGWARQAAVARAWAGAPGGTTCEELAAALAGVADADLAATVRAVVARRARPDGRTSVAPAAVAWVMTPEEQVLAPLGMAAWDDPFAALVAAIERGDLDLAPTADAGFYRRRWHALETLAAPRLAPETQKLQLTADYLRRWRRAFAAGFSEGRSGLVKRLPEMCLGLSESGPVPVEIAPQFTAEPAPIVYLRLGRAYRALGRDLEQALGSADWEGLRDAAGAGLAAAVAARAELCFGLGAAVSAELGFPFQPAADETGYDLPTALAAARRWAAGCVEDPDVAADARLLVTLAQDGTGRHRCPAILGIRLEPVVYRWVEEPEIAGEVDPSFVPARYWLPSPCPAAVTVEAVPDPPAFRAQCDAHAEVAPLYAAFGQRAPALREMQRPWWPWAIAGILAVAALAMARIGWRALPPDRRATLLTTVLITVLTVLLWLACLPPYALVRLVARDAIPINENIALVVRDAFGCWSADHGKRLFLDLLGDPDPQVRYLVTWLPLRVRYADFTAEDVAVLRGASDDAVPEVARLAWSIRCRSSEDAVALVAELERTAAAGRLGDRLWDLLGQRPDDAAVQAAALRLADDASDERRTAVFRNLWHWEAPPPVLLRIRTALGDPCQDVRRAAARHLGDHGTADDIPALLALLRDGDAGVRMAAFRAVGRRVVNNEHPKADDGRPHWSNPAIQEAVLRYVRDPAMTADERLSAGWRITDPATHRAVSRELLAVADALPESDRRNAKGDQYMRTLWPRAYAHAHLVHRWLTAAMDETASYEGDGSLQAHPALLAPLLQAMRDDADLAAALPALERSLASRELAHATLLLIEEIGPPAAPLADAIIAFRPSAKDCERWHTLSALQAMGPAVADRALPLIREAALDPVDGWRAKRLLEPGP